MRDASVQAGASLTTTAPTLAVAIEGPPPIASWGALAACPTMARALRQCQTDLALYEPELARGGKMFGVLLCEGPDGLTMLRAHSGMLAGQWQAPGFCPPIWDVSQRNAFFDEVQDRLGRLADIIAREQQSLGPASAAPEAPSAVTADPVWVENRRARQRERASLPACDCHGCDVCRRRQALDAASRADGRTKRAARDNALAHVTATRQLWRRQTRRLRAAERLRARISRRSQAAIFDLAFLHVGQAPVPLRNFFHGTPPGGAGDCAAPKLLSYAMRAGLRPLALAEFWWGQSDGAHTEGSLYPPCTTKCGPIMARYRQTGLLANAATAPDLPAYATLFEDDAICIVNKAAGVPSVAGRTGLRSIETMVGATCAHRLDEDTSGLLLLAKTPAALQHLRAQFALRTVTKQYWAWVIGHPSDAGTIDLPLGPDLTARPRQRVDRVRGKAATTDYRVLVRDGDRTLCELTPHTGRSHQLRVHASHPEGLAAPIEGDRIYGTPGPRLLLHATSLAFVHPCTGARIEFHCPAPFAPVVT